MLPVDTKSSQICQRMDESVSVLDAKHQVIVNSSQKAPAIPVSVEARPYRKGRRRHRKLKFPKKYSVKEDTSGQELRQPSELMNTQVHHGSVPSKPCPLIGKANEVEVSIQGHKCIALVDTGSMVSTICEDLCKQLNLDIQPLGDLIQLEGAGGHQLTYLGFVGANIQLHGLENPKQQGRDREVGALLLVVPKTKYQERVPLLIGTNMLNSLLDLQQDDLQATEFSVPWQMALKSIQLMRQVQSNSQSLGTVASAKELVIYPGEKKRIRGITRAGSNLCQPLTVCLDDNGSLPAGLAVCSSYQKLKPRVSTQRMEVEISNFSEREIIVPAKSILCQVFQANLVDPSVTSLELDPSVVTDQDSGPDNTSSMEKMFEQLQVHLDSTQVQEVKNVLLRWKTVFSQHDLDLGHCTKVKHCINLSDNVPFKDKYRNIPPAMIDEVRQHLKEMLDLGVIRPSTSPYASNVVLVRKKDGSLRFCVDFRKLNSRTIKDAYALPRIEESFHALVGATYFSTLDLKSSYWQVELEEQDKPKTAFMVGHLGFWECERMPFGLTNAPATFQRLIESCMGDLNMNQCLLYLDDIVVFSSTYEEHLERLQAVFARLQDSGLKLKPEKCQLFQRQIKYLGHLVSSDGVATDPDKLSCVRDWPVPKSIKEVQSFLGFAGYFRRFIKNFSRIARPLHECTGGQTKKKISPQRKPKFQWTPEQEEAFNKLKECLTSTPVLAFADFKKPFILHTDASLDGLGAVLYQKQDDGSERVIAYASKGLSKSQRNYPAHKLEFLALKWAVVDKFHDYLYGNEFSVVTDNNPLTYILSTAKVDATGQRWISHLSNYRFTIHYRPGKNNTDADALSRIHWPVISEVIKAQLNHDSLCEGLCMSHHAIPNLDHVDGSSIGEHKHKDWKKLQREDPHIAQVIHLVEGNDVDQTMVGPDFSVYAREKKNLLLIDGVLHRKRLVDGEMCYQLILPAKFRRTALYGCHNQVGHMGRDRTIDLLKERFYWAGMTKEAAAYVANCGRCIRRKTPPNQRAPLINIVTTQPMELVSVDFLSLEASKGGFEHILVITDHFTKYAQAFATRNQTAETTARVLYENFIVHYGFPARLHADQGKNFESRTIKALCDLANIKKSRTTPYHAMGNGQTERMNKTLLDMLGTLQPNQKKDWKKHLQTIVHAYNCTKHESTGYSPFFLMFMRQPRLPVDLALGIDPEEKSTLSYPSFVVSLKKRLQYAFELATKKAKEAQQKQKKYFDRKIRGAVLAPGDIVLIRNVAFKGKHKIEDRWQEDLYQVMEQPNPNIPVYKVKPKDHQGKEKTLHRNLLLPLFSLPIEEPLEEGSKQTKQPVQKPEQAKANRLPGENNHQSLDTDLASSALGVDTASDSTSEEEEVPVLRRSKRKIKENRDFKPLSQGLGARNRVRTNQKQTNGESSGALDVQTSGEHENMGSVNTTGPLAVISDPLEQDIPNGTTAIPSSVPTSETQDLEVNNREEINFEQEDNPDSSINEVGELNLTGIESQDNSIKAESEADLQLHLETSFEDSDYEHENSSEESNDDQSVSGNDEEAGMIEVVTEANSHIGLEEHESGQQNITEEQESGQQPVMEEQANGHQNITEEQENQSGNQTDVDEHLSGHQSAEESVVQRPASPPNPKPRRRQPNLEVLPTPPPRQRKRPGWMDPTVYQFDQHLHTTGNNMKLQISKGKEKNIQVKPDHKASVIQLLQSIVDKI